MKFDGQIGSILLFLGHIESFQDEDDFALLNNLKERSTHWAKANSKPPEVPQLKLFAELKKDTESKILLKDLQT